MINEMLKKCVSCKRLRGNTASQAMGDLPLERLASTTAFEHVGIDCFGPFHITEGKTTRKNSSTKKLFVLIINCLASRAVHLEPLAGMDSVSVINALRRFISIRGPCMSILSDHGSNFLGALGQNEEFQLVKEEVVSRGILWRMNPVGASHFGGAFERKIGSVRRVLEAFLLPLSTPINRDEFCTLLQEAAYIVNSTPLYPSPGGPDDPLALCPLNLLTLKTIPLNSLPSAFTDRDLLSYGARRWRRVQALADNFWRRWRDNYVHELTRKSKWFDPRRDLSEGDVVLLRDKGTPRCQWRLAVVRRPIPGSDTRVRRVVIAVSDARGRIRETERAIVDLIPLFNANEASNDN